MRRAVERALQALGGRDAGFGRGRLTHLLPPIFVGLESLSVMAPSDGEGKRWGGALLSRRDEHHGGVLPGCSRGFAAGHDWTPSGGGARGRGRAGRGGGPRSGGGGRGRGGGGVGLLS